MNRTRAALSLLLLAAAACSGGDAGEWSGTITDSAGVAVVSNPADGQWTLRAAPTLTRSLDIGEVEGEGAYQFGQVAAVDVNAAGEILVLDQQAAQVRVFDGTGRHVRTIGKPGGGPGEFSQMTMAVRAGGGDSLYVADMMRQRIVGLTGDGVEFASYPLAIERGIPLRFQPAPDGRLAVQVRRMAMPGTTSQEPARDFIIVTDLKGERADTVAELESGATFSFGAERMEMRIFASEPMWTMLEDGRIVRGRTDLYRFEVFSKDGTLERVITRPVEARPVTLEDQNAYKDMMRRLIPRQQPAATPQIIEMLMSSMKFADRFPVYANLMGGPDNTLWVQRFPESLRFPEGAEPDLQNLSVPDWDVFDAEGRLLGMVTMPDRFNPLRVVGSDIYGVQLDEFDVQHVVRLRID